MAAFLHLRMFWGAVDVELANFPQYSGTAVQSGGDSAAQDVGVGVRRASLRFSRAALGTPDDDCVMHFDFLNLTGGSPDDTWTSGDYSTLESLLSTWWGTVRGYSCAGCTFEEIRWYRIGPGVAVPNAAQRITPVNVAGNAGTAMAAWQSAASITFRTAARRQWGRTYLPGLSVSVFTTEGRFDDGFVDDLAGATATMFASSSSSDFYPVVYSPTKHNTFGVEHVEVDNVPDVIRKRRLKHTTYKSISS